MAPSGADDISSREMSSSLPLLADRPTYSVLLSMFARRTQDVAAASSAPRHHHLLGARDLTASEGVLMTHLVVWLLTLLSGGFFGLRVFAKCYRKAGLAVDDALLAAAWAAVLFYSILTSLELALGVGTDSSSSSSSSITNISNNKQALILLDHVARTFCLIAAAWSKSAVAVLFLKIPSSGRGSRKIAAAGSTSKRWHPVLHGVLFGFIAVVNTGLAAAVIAHWFRCMPVSKEWDDSIEGTCWSLGVHSAIGIAAQSFSGAMDVALVAMGVVLVWGTGLSTGGKAGVVGLSILGVIACAGSVTTAIEISTLTDSNFASANLRILLAASIETPIVIIAASLPCLRLFTSAASTKSTKPYLKHASPSNSTTIRLIPAASILHTPTTANGEYHQPPLTSQSSVFPPPTPTQQQQALHSIRPKPSFSSSVTSSPSVGGASAGGVWERPPPIRPPRPASGETGMFWTDPTAPAAMNPGGVRGRGVGGGGASTRVHPGDNTNNNTWNNEESSRGLFVQTPKEARLPHAPAAASNGVPGWGYNSNHTNNKNDDHSALSRSPSNHDPSKPPTDPFDAYEPDSVSSTNNNGNVNPSYYYTQGGLLAPRALTPLEEEEQQQQDSRSSYHTSRLSSQSGSTMTNSHWLDIPPSPGFLRRDDFGGGGGDDEGGNSNNNRRASSKFSVSGFIDSYGARAASVVRKMELIVPMGASGGGGGASSSPSSSSPSSQQQQQQYEGRRWAGQQQQSQHGMGMHVQGLKLGSKAGNRDSPTLGDYWESAPSSPAVAATPSTTTAATTTTTTRSGRVPAAGAGLWNVGRRPPLGNTSHNNLSSLSTMYTDSNRF